MDDPPIDLHFVLFPLMAQGHLIPMVDLARILAQRGAMVTIITSPVNANRFKSVIGRAIEAKLNIRILELQLPLAEVGLPDGYENFDLLPSPADVLKMYSVMLLLEEPAEKMLRALSTPPSCIISDGHFPWTSDLAMRFNIPRLVFYGPGCFAFLCIHIMTNTNILDQIDSDSKYFVIPGLPDEIEVTKPQASTWGKGDSEETTDMFERMQIAEKASSGIVVNSFEELEPKYVEEFAKAKDKRVWCIGPVSLCNKSFQDIAERGNKVVVNKNDCLKWLDSREPASVVYVCLGSLWYASTEQAIELGLGLELSNTPFIWFVRETSDELERWLLEEGYEERIKDKGLMVRGWAPQILILSHQAIGGFVTHCGWNSTLEAICAGVTMVTWPHFAEQFLNERFIIDVLKIGVRIGAEVPVMYVLQDKSEVTIKRQNVKKAVKILMNNDEEGEARRNRAKALSIKAKRSMEEGGSSFLNMTLMIKGVTEEVAKNTNSIQDVYPI
uniref:UDP-glycosyltransferase 73E1-like n=1 Tax=Erigeron canadensis TaxID=72917 RepID=UPI001CB8EBDD|nr:UDP-glycosyltransferase 73E1-like [Erigeron canadensis]